MQLQPFLDIRFAKIAWQLWAETSLQDDILKVSRGTGVERPHKWWCLEAGQCLSRASSLVCCSLTKIGWFPSVFHLCNMSTPVQVLS